MGNKQSLSKKKLKKFRKEVQMSDAEIKEWHREYRKNCTTGNKLTLKEFKTVYNSMFPGDASQFAERVFKTFDKDGNGEVDFREFLIGLSVTSSSNTENKLRWAFDMYDLDGNGNISRNEMLHMVSAVFKMTGSQLQLPKDSSSPELLADKIFSKMDIDGDGEITWQEFRDGALEDPLVIRLLQLDPDT